MAWFRHCVWSTTQGPFKAPPHGFAGSCICLRYIALNNVHARNPQKEDQETRQARKTKTHQIRHRQLKRQNQRESTERTFSSRRRPLLSRLPFLFFPPPGLHPLRLLPLLPSVLRGQSGLAPRLEEDVVGVDRVVIRKKREGRVRLLFQPQENFQLEIGTRSSAIGGEGGGRMGTLTPLPNVGLRKRMPVV